MKIGDKVEIIRLAHEDQDSGLKIGTIGTIRGWNGSANVFYVDFHGALSLSGHNNNYDDSDGTYQMYGFQLEVIKD